MRLHLLLLRTILPAISSASILTFSTTATAAERIVLTYSILRQSVSVPELSTFARTGELSPSLRAYLSLARRDPEEVRRVLTQEVSVNPVILYQVLNSKIGEAALDRVAEVIYTPGNPANRQALRSALVSSALEDGKITLIEAIENYPTPEVQVDGDRLVSFYRQLSNLAQRLPKL